MSGHSKFANIKHKKEKNDAAKGKIFTIIGREIAVAVKRYLAPASYDSVSFLLLAIKAAIGNDAVSSPIKNSKKCPDETIKYIPNKVTNNNS